MSEKKDFDDIMSGLSVPPGVDRELVVLAEASPQDICDATGIALKRHFEPSPDDQPGLYNVEFAAKIYETRYELTKTMRRVVPLIGATAMGASTYFAISEAKNIDALARNNTPGQAVINGKEISDSQIEDASRFFAALSAISGLLVGKIFSSSLDEAEARRRARKMVKKALENK